MTTPSRLDERQRRLLLEEWNATDVVYPDDPCIHDLLAAQAEQKPHAVAVEDEDTCLTYADLHRRADLVSSRLRALGVQPDDLVGIYLTRSYRVLVAMLGVIKAGAAYVPLDPDYPPDRLELMLSDSRPVAVLTETGLVDRVAGTPAHVICLDTDDGSGGGPEPEAPSTARPGNLAYVIYTSGSTGTPKGVQVTHRNLVNSTRARWLYYRQPVESFLLLSSFSFDSSVAGIYWTLSAGGRLIVAPERVQRDPAAIAAALHERHVSHVLSVPSLYGVFLDQLDADKVPALSTVIVAGESCTRELVQRHQERLSHVSLFNEYGPTEATVWSTVHDCALPARGTQVPIGRPIANTRIYLLDDAMEPVPVGEPGELYVGGSGVARGYLNRPDLTAERFVPDPFGRQPNARLYRTGDLARYNDDGLLEFIGRRDEQVKIRGYRIELGEIEAALAEHPAAREVAVVAREDARRVKRLVAYVVLREGAMPAVLRAHLQERLPAHMVPAAFVALDKLPTLPNGKVDRKALPEPARVRPELSAPYTEPRTETERRLAAIWTALLGIDRVGIHDNFLDLGGDSLLAMQVMIAAREAGVYISATQLARTSTIAELASVAGSASPRIDAEQGPVSGPVLLTPVQRHFLQRNMRRRHGKVAHSVYDVQEPLDPTTLEQAVGHVVAHHDALRLRFTQRGSEWQALMAEQEDHAIFYHADLAGLDTCERDAAVQEIRAELRQTLDLTHGPLIRVAYLSLPPGTPGRLLVLADHLVVDGFSMPILMQDLETSYRQLSRGETVRLPAKTTSVKRWAERLREYASSPELLQEQEYWSAISRRRLPPLPADHEVIADSRGESRDVLAVLDASDTKALLSNLQGGGTRIDAALLAALSAGIGEWSGTGAIRVSLRSHGREPIFDDLDVSRTVGWFTCSYPVLVPCQSGGGPMGLTRSVQEEIDRVPHHGIGYGILRFLADHLGPRSQVPGPAPHAGLNYQGNTDQLYAGLSLFTPRIPVRERQREREGRVYPQIQVTGRVHAGSLGLRLTYHENVYRRETIEQLARSVERFLRDLVASDASLQSAG